MITRLATVWPGTKFRLDALGRGVPLGYAVRKLGAVGFVTVTLRATAVTPAAGTPPRPDTWRFSVEAWPSDPRNPPVPSRVSSSRAGVSPLNNPAVGDAVGGPNQPSTSTTTCTVPRKLMI